MLDLLLDSLLDSLKVFAVAFVLYFIFSFLHEKVTQLFQKHKGISPVVGATCGLIPECGISIVGADMYQKKQISRGTILAIFFACSDEALFILFSDYHKMIYILPLLGIKFIFACILGYVVDVKASSLNTIDEVKLDCCEHEHKEETWIHKHLLHPFSHCFTIFLYVFIINLFFGMLVYSIGEEVILTFLKSNEWLSPLFAGFIGLIPNCASSVLMTELFLMNGLSFGALVTGLSINSGLGLMYLLRFKETRKDALWMTLIVFAYALLIGYSIMGLMRLF